MAKYQDSISDSATGRPIANVTVQVFDYPSGDVATLYTAEGAVTTAPIISDSDGAYSFYALSGRYNIVYYHGGITKTLTDIQVGGMQGIPGPASSGYTLLSSYGSLTAMVAAVGADPQTVGIDASTTLSANITIPANIELLPINGAIINHGSYTISYAGSTARWPRAQVFNGTGAITGLSGAAHLEWLGAKGDGTTSGDSAFTRTLQSGASKVIGAYKSSGYLLTIQMDIPSSVQVDLSGSKVVIGGTLLTDASLPSVFRFVGDRGSLVNVGGNLRANQYVVSATATATNNYEMNCYNVTYGPSGVFQPEWSSEVNNAGTGWVSSGNYNAHKNNNRSYTYEGLAKGSLLGSGTEKILSIDISSVGASSLKIFNFNQFPTRARIKRIVCTDTGGSPNFQLEAYNDLTGGYVQAGTFYWRAFGGDIDYATDIPYERKERNDVITFVLRNAKVTSANFHLEIHFEEIKYGSIGNVVWGLYGKEDLNRPHSDSPTYSPYYDAAYPSNATTIKSVEYRFTTVADPTAYRAMAIMPSVTDAANRIAINIPTPLTNPTQNLTGTLATDVSASLLKFYINYPASRAVIEKPTHFEMVFSNTSKAFAGALNFGWLSQNYDNDPAWLKGVWNFASVQDTLFDIPTPATSGYIVRIPLDPKAYQLASSLEGDLAANFFYFTFHTYDPAKCFDYAASMLIQARFIKVQ